MILGTHDDLKRHGELFRGADSTPLFDWLATCRDAAPDTKVEFLGDKMFARVLREDTAPRDACRWETHREYVDLQYGLGGGEIIDWAPAAKLNPAGPHDETKDVQFYGSSTQDLAVPMGDGLFVFLFPTDAHRPLVSDGRNRQIHKVVVKIHRSLLVI
ncbi:MAG: DUF386 domain-containing protein [Chthoniobacterales bacterium]|nr:DUF386 domain-containing protein [Chthoniobacterales bacterium]